MAEEKNVTVVTNRGQASIPAQLRKELALTAGQHLLWEKAGEREIRVTVLEGPIQGGAQSMRGFARRFRNEARTTAEWMSELRAARS